MDQTAFEELLQRNKEVAKTYQTPPDLMTALKQKRPGFIIISCSDPRLNPYKIFGLDQSVQARITMIRNAGGRALDAVRTISVLQTIGDAKTVVIMHHTDCGMTHVNDDIVRQALLKIAPEEKDAISNIHYGEITGSIESSIQHDVALLHGSPFITPGTRIVGLAYDIKTGILTQVVERRRGE